MCVSHQNIDQLAYSTAEQIVQLTIYRPLYIELIGEGRFAIEAGKPFLAERRGVISKILLTDKDGNIYRIEPDEIGLQFAQGNIDYKEYLYQQKKGNRQLIGLTFGLVTLFATAGWGFVTLF
ncbi:hypothetical protein [Mesobacillus subterraneus]|uniref:Uncharacterized protein n=1 Tax=Mesobacillus subterraneus TaxID=285983 RepID=A0A3R9F0B8_9BACI|nr:hypothetical protein [Mesobacillus subterraneus]RSD26260.1 hypothetical protein EJA10_15705 [Mesobacillus subterraneus]